MILLEINLSKWKQNPTTTQVEYRIVEEFQEMYDYHALLNERQSGPQTQRAWQVVEITFGFGAVPKPSYAL